MITATSKFDDKLHVVECGMLFCLAFQCTINCFIGEQESEIERKRETDAIEPRDAVTCALDPIRPNILLTELRGLR